MQAFSLFSGPHIVTIILTYLIIAAILFWVSNQSNEIKKNAKVSIGVLLITHYFMQFLHAVSFDLSWQEIIPLHMCDFSKLAIGLYLLGYDKRLFHCALFWGTIPASMALLTPALTYGYPDPEYINFYYGHGLILLGVGMPVFVLKERPQFADFIFVIKVTLAMTAIIFILNHLLGEGANFWYLKDKPNGDTIINLFPSAPFHILGLIPAAIFAFYLTYLPYQLKDKISGS